MTFMTPTQIRQCGPEPLPHDARAPLERARERMRRTGQWHPWQAIGRRYAIGCVALEITQRCNLDCTLCYLSESAEAVHDIPIEEVFRRIDMILAHYGPETDIQVTGGDPTLRRRDELVAIVRRIADRGMRASLFTNGIRATRSLLAELSAAGLTDVAFHVDLTQQRKGYDSEEALNEIRRTYIERARGLPLAVIFNTTVFDGNLHEIPALVRFFVRHCDAVRFCSFQLQAATGRGTLGARTAALVTSDSVARLIADGVGAPISFGALGAGHPECNRYALTLVVHNRVYDLFSDRAFAAAALEATRGLAFDRTHPRRTLIALGGWLLRHPAALLQGLPWAAGHIWRLRRDLVAARGRVDKLSFFIHNFMDACSLEHERVDACAFMVATRDGPLSMCLHNAKRDEYLLGPIELRGAERVRFWNPLTGMLSDAPPARIEVRHTRKTARGRTRQALEAARREG
jgi:pyruvate-formate lyase-activating enzyme